MDKSDYIFRSSRSSSRRRSSRDRQRYQVPGDEGNSGYRRSRLAERRQARRRRTFLFILISGAVVAALVFSGVLLFIHGSGASPAGAAPAEAATPNDGGSGTVIITGNDDSGRLSQLAVLVPEDGGGFSLYTIPPRTIADTPGYGFKQLADVPGLGGQELLDQTVANLLQVPIQYHIRLDYGALDQAAAKAGTINFKSDRPLSIAVSGEIVNLTAGDNPVSASRSLPLLKASVENGAAGPRLQALFYQGLHDSLALKSESERRELARTLYGKVGTDLDQSDFIDLFAAATTQGRPFGAWPLPVSQAGNGAAWYLEPAPAEIEVLMTGTSRDAAVNLEIHNGTETAGVVEAAAARLAPLRYTTTLQTDPSGVDFDETQIRAGSDALTAANRVRGVLGKGAIIKDEYMEKHQIIVIMGRDITLADLEKR